MSKILLIDDQRNLTADYTARTYDEGIDQLMHHGPWSLLLLDHDLASYGANGVEKTGYDVMCFLEEFPEYLPGEIRCVSDNPVGRRRIGVVINKLYKK